MNSLKNPDSDVETLDSLEGDWDQLRTQQDIKSLAGFYYQLVFNFSSAIFFIFSFSWIIGNDGTCITTIKAFTNSLPFCYF